MATSTINNVVTDASGDPIVGARVVARLVPAPAWRIADGSEVEAVVETVTDGSGEWALVLEETASITPANSVYRVEEYLPAGTRRHTIQVGAGDQSLLAALVTPPAPSYSGPTLLTQESADARYQQLGSLGGSAVDVDETASNGSSGSAARADHRHRLQHSADFAFASSVFGLASGRRLHRVATSEPAGLSEGDLWSETDVDRVRAYSGSASPQIGHWSASGRGGVSLRRATNLTCNDTATTTVTWGTEDHDPDGWIAVSASTITVPAGCDGWYCGQFAPEFVTNATYTNLLATLTYTPNGGAGVDYLWPFTAVSLGAVAGQRLVYPISMPLGAGDTLVWKFLQTSGANRSFLFDLDLIYVGR